VKAPVVPVVANVLAKPIRDPADIVERARCASDRTVRWRDSITFMADAGVARFCEVGAGKVLSGLIKAHRRRGKRRFGWYAGGRGGVQGAARLDICSGALSTREARDRGRVTGVMLAIAGPITSVRYDSPDKGGTHNQTAISVLSRSGKQVSTKERD
jgi:acyl transferase domain-containing protein